MLLTSSLTFAGRFSQALNNLETKNDTRTKGRFAIAYEKIASRSYFLDLDLENFNLDQNEITELSCSLKKSTINRKYFSTNFSEIEQLRIKLFIAERCQ